MKKDDRVKVTKLMKSNRTNRSIEGIITSKNDNIKDYDRAWEDDRL